MFKHKLAILRKVNIVFDLFLIGAAYLAVLGIRIYIDMGDFYSLESYLPYLWIMIFPLILWPLLINVNGLYPTDRLRTFSRAALIISKSSIQGILLFLAFLFIFKIEIVSRLFVFIFAIIATMLLTLKESALIGYFHHLREKGANFRTVIVAGTLKSTKGIVDTIRENPFLGLRLEGLLVPKEEAASREEYDGVKVLGSLEEIEKALHSQPIDHVIVTVNRSDYGEVDNILSACEREGVELWITADIFKIKIAKLDSDELFGIPLFVFRTTPRFSWQLLTKIVFDRIGGTILAIITFPVVLIAAILIKLTSPGPILFKQSRCGIQGREFVLYKLRTMQVGADKKKEDLMANNIITGPAFKIENDPRITLLGRFLRKTSIDELPQFWNVIKGDMSIVGPRPPLPEEVIDYHGWHRRRLSMKPGITGLWQVSGRNEIADFNKWVELDLEYIDKWSLWLDLKIFFRTIYVVFTGFGAR